MSAGEHVTTIKARGYHADAYGHVHHARYLELLEEARWRWLEERMDLTQLAASGLGFAVVNVNVDYRRAVRPGEVLEIHTRLRRRTERSGTVSQRILLAGDSAVVAEAEITFVIISVETGKPAAMSAEIREALGPPAEG